MYVYDCANILYSCKPLSCFAVTTEEAATISLTMVSLASCNHIHFQDDIKSPFSKNFIGNRCESVVVKVLPTLTFAYSTATSTLDKNRETQQFLEVLTSALLYKKY